MDKRLEEIVRELLQMTKEERKEVLAVVKFIKWRDRGGTKTDEISRGETLYFWVMAHGDSGVTA